MKLIIEDEEGRKSVFQFVREEISIGRQEGNTIRLTERNVSRKHARLLRKNGSVLVEDLSSFNGVRVNGDRIEGQLPIQEGDLVEIGDYDLAIENEAQDAASAPAITPNAERAAGRAPTDPSPQLASGRAPTVKEPEPLPLDDLAPVEADEDGAAPEKHQATAIIRTQSLQGPARQVEDLDPSERPRLVLLNTDEAGRELAIERTELRIGRTTGDNDVAINHRSISRNHAKLIRDPDGSWRILDLQSANGVTVNGESYTDAPLASGDRIELGHVKARFVGPGESFSFSPDVAEDAAPRPEKKPPLGLLAGIAGAVAVAGAAVFFLVPSRRVAPPSSVPPRAEIARATPQPPPAAPPSAHSPSAEPATPVRTTHPAIAPAMAPREEAGPTRPSRSAIHRQISELVAQSRSAIKAHRLAVADEKLQAAQELSADDPTVVRLRKDVQASHDREERAERHRADRKVAAEAPQPARPAAKSDHKVRAAQAYEAAIGLIGSSDFVGALAKLKQALELEPSMADAQKAMGICYAKLQEPEQGATHYEQYLKLQPNAPDAPAVRRMLADYYRSKGQ